MGFLDKMMGKVPGTEAHVDALEASLDEEKKEMGAQLKSAVRQVLELIPGTEAHVDGLEAKIDGEPNLADKAQESLKQAIDSLKEVANAIMAKFPGTKAEVEALMQAADNHGDLLTLGVEIKEEEKAALMDGKMFKLDTIADQLEAAMMQAEVAAAEGDLADGTQAAVEDDIEKTG